MHLYNHVACGRKEYPLTNKAKAHFMNEVKRHSVFFQLEIISVAAMSNHFHICCFCSGDMLSDEEVVRRHNIYYAGNDLHPQIDLTDQHIILREKVRMHDVSEFMKELQRGFTIWFNAVVQPGRMGTLWAGRYKSTILQASEKRASMGNSALFHCVKYVEMNPLRAKMVDDPGDYPYSTWGIYESTGKHPFEVNFLKHMRRMHGERGEDMTDNQLKDHLRSQMARSYTVEKAMYKDHSFKLEREFKEKMPAVLTVGCKFRYWIDGGIIGSKEFVKENTGYFQGETVAAKHRQDHIYGQHTDEGDFYSFHRLKTVS